MHGAEFCAGPKQTACSDMQSSGVSPALLLNHDKADVTCELQFVLAIGLALSDHIAADCGMPLQ